MLGLFRSAGSFARTIGPLIASSMYFMLGDNTAYLIGAFLVFIASVMFKTKVRLLSIKPVNNNPI